MTPRHLQRVLPRASKSFLRANASDCAPSQKPVAPAATEFFCAESKDEQRLNKTEREWLGNLRADTLVQFLGIQSITLKLGDDCRYTPDFVTIKAGGMVAWEVKGFFRDDAKVKIKVAARMYPFITFVLVRKDKCGFALTKVNP